MGYERSTVNAVREDRSELDPFEVRKHYQPLRVVDVCDALDGIGYFNIGLMSPEVRPLWLGMKFWGVAYTIRCVPSNRPMWPLDTTQDVVDAHRIWFETVEPRPSYLDELQAGHVLVMDCGGAEQVGYWGSENSMGVMRRGAVGIITNGECRDTAEVLAQKTPVVAKRRGRTIIPGRIHLVDKQSPIGCGGVQVRPGDIVGCDDDGVVVVPLEVARPVAAHAREILLADMRKRRDHYSALKITPDETVDYDSVVRYYQSLDG
jgi:regulator of RNase E activity RraA